MVSRSGEAKISSICVPRNEESINGTDRDGCEVIRKQDYNLYSSDTLHSCRWGYHRLPKVARVGKEKWTQIFEFWK
jgi:hypothetical protein